MPYYKDNKRLHDSVVIKLAKKLKELHKDHEIIINPQIKKQGSIRLIDGTIYYPDIIDKTTKTVYEVHWKGKRKELEFDKLPVGWQGINIFIDDSTTPYTIVVKMPGFRYVIVDNVEFSDL